MFEKLFALLLFAFLVSPSLSSGPNEHIRFGAENQAEREVRELQLQMRKVNDNPLLSETDKKKKVDEIKGQLTAAMESLSKSRQRSIEDEIRQRSIDGRKPKPHGHADSFDGNHQMIDRVDKQCKDFREKLAQRTDLQQEVIESTKQKIDFFCENERKLISEKAEEHAKMRSITSQIQDPKERSKALHAYHEEIKSKRDPKGQMELHKRIADMRREVLEVLFARKQDL